MQSKHILRGVIAVLLAAACVIGADSTAAQSRSEGAPTGAPRTVIVTLDDGQRLTGELVGETDDAITLRIGGIETTIDREFIERITTLRPAIERYRSMRAVIDDENVEQLLLLIDWLRAEELFDEALAEVTDVLEREPQNGRALRLKELIERQITLRNSQVAGADGGRGERTALPSRRPRSLDFPLISDADANLLKVYETDLDDPPRLLIERETVDRLVEQYGGLGDIPTDEESVESFRDLSPDRLLAHMFDVRARDLYSEVKVLDLPESLRQFRDNVQTTWLVNSCGTTACHGGLDAGPFMLFNRATGAEIPTLTNLLILERYRLSDGRRLLNYEDPDQSPLLQMALAPRLSSSPHPEVRGWRPVFTSKRARRYEQTIAWMDAMIRPRPEIPIVYQPPRPADFRTDEASEPADGAEEREPQER